MRVWLTRFRTALAVAAALFLLLKMPEALQLIQRPVQDPGSAASPPFVLRVWLSDNWSGSSMQWLSKQAAAFEKANKNVRVLLRRVKMEDLALEGVVMPDVLLFSKGDVEDPEALFWPAREGLPVRGLLGASGMWKGRMYAVPVAYGGYVRLTNAQNAEEDIELIYETEAEYQAFVGKKAASLIATVREARRLSALEAAGKGFPFSAEPYGETTDKLLMAGVLQNDADRTEKSDAFIASLLGVNAQSALPEYGLLPASPNADAPDEAKQPLLYALQGQITGAANAFD